MRAEKLKLFCDQNNMMIHNGKIKNKNDYSDSDSDQELEVKAKPKLGASKSVSNLKQRPQTTRNAQSSNKNRVSLNTKDSTDIKSNNYLLNQN